MIKNIIIIFCLIFMLTACSSKVAIGAYNVKNSNLNHRGDDVPVTVIVYKLNDIKKFQIADENELLNNEDTILGKDKIDSIKLQLKPNSKTKILELDKDEVRFVGILVFYADQKKLSTRAYKDLDTIKDNYLFFEIKDSGVEIFTTKEMQ